MMSASKPKRSTICEVQPIPRDSYGKDNFSTPRESAKDDVTKRNFARSALSVFWLLM